MSDTAGLDFLDLAHDGFQSKLKRLEREEWHEAFKKVRLNAAIMRDFLHFKTIP